MNTYLMILFILSFSGGSSGILLSVLLYFKYKNKNILFYTATLIFWSLNFFSIKILTLINEVFLSNNLIYAEIIRLVNYFSWAGLTFFLPLTTLKLLKINIKNRHIIIFLFSSLILAIPSHNFISNNKYKLFFIIFYFIQVIIHFSILYYGLLIIQFNIKKIKNNEIKNFLKNFVIIMHIFYPFFFIELTPFFLYYFKYGVGIYPLFYFTLNTLWLIFIQKFIYFPRVKISASNYDQEDFFSIYSLTNREKEIVFLILKGLSYLEISDKLYISFETVKTHINNIYKKTKVSGKVELIQLFNKIKQ